MLPNERLEVLLARAEKNLGKRETKNAEDRERVEYVASYTDNRAPIRLLMSSLLAKLDSPKIDPRKPYTEIGTPDCFSGRSYDERYVGAFVAKHRLPCNSTTAFLTPGFRNFNRALMIDVPPVGRPKELYSKLFALLDAVANSRESAAAVLTDALRVLLTIRNTRLGQLESLQASLRQPAGKISLSSEMILSLIRQHLACRGSSRLPVLLFAAAYDAVGGCIGEKRKPLHSHNSADEQTGALGDIEVVLNNDDQIRSAYEMKQKRVTADDIDRALQKIASSSSRIDNYIFVTTDSIDAAVVEYAMGQFAKVGGIEVAIVDCVGFLGHFLHFFHRHRIAFLEAYQTLVLSEPDSAVSVPLKTALLSLRQAAESEA